MKPIEKILLIEGNFEPMEAKEILINIISNKIQFHQLKNFSSMERFGKSDTQSQKRIPELREAMSKVQQILNEAQKSDKKLLITSKIEIQFYD